MRHRLVPIQSAVPPNIAIPIDTCDPNEGPMFSSPVGDGVMTAALAVGLCLLGGCAAPVRSVRPSVDPNALSETAFVHYLAATSVVTVDEGARAVLLVVGDDAADTDAVQRWDVLLDRGAVRSRWVVVSETVLDRGTFAFMLCRVLGVPRGFNDTLAAATGLGERRAALRTAVFEGLIDYGPAYNPITGPEVASTLVRAEQWQSRGSGPGVGGS